MIGNRRPEGRALYQRYVEGAVTLGGPELEALAEAVTQTGVYTVMGVIEKWVAPCTAPP